MRWILPALVIFSLLAAPPSEARKRRKRDKVREECVRVLVRECEPVTCVRICEPIYVNPCPTEYVSWRPSYVYIRPARIGYQYGVKGQRLETPPIQGEGASVAQTDVRQK